MNTPEILPKILLAVKWNSRDEVAQVVTVHVLSLLKHLWYRGITGIKLSQSLAVDKSSINIIFCLVSSRQMQYMFHLHLIKGVLFLLNLYKYWAVWFILLRCISISWLIYQFFHVYKKCFQYFFPRCTVYWRNGHLSVLSKPWSCWTATIQIPWSGTLLYAASKNTWLMTNCPSTSSSLYR